MILKDIKTLFDANDLFVHYILKNHKRMFLVKFCSVILNGFAAMVVSHTSKLFIESIYLSNGIVYAMKYIIFWMLYILVMNIVENCSNLYCNYTYSKAKLVVKEDLYSKISNLTFSYYDIPENKDALSRVVKYSENAGPQLMNYFFSLLANIIGAISIFYLLLPFAWWIVFFLIALISYRSLMDTLISKENYSFQKNNTLLMRKIMYYEQIFLDPNQVLDMNIYNASSFFFSNYKKSKDEYIRLVKKHEAKKNTLNILSVVAIVIQNVILYLYIGQQMIKGLVTVADFTMFFTAVNYFNIILSNFRKTFSSFVPMVLDSKNYNDFLNLSNQYKYIEINKVEEKKIIDCIEKIEFKDVSFKYPLKQEYTLKNISFQINKGELLILTGINGAGKTTLLKLLLNLYSPTEGQILVNSIPLECIDIASYWKCCGIMLQNINIYSISACENIAFNRIEKDNFYDILNAVGMQEFFEKQDDGIYTELSRSFSKKGVLLSEGQRQKIALARLFYHNDDFLIMDEPTSSMDTKSEKNIIDLIIRTRQTDKCKTFVIISHKLSFCIGADKVLFLKNGRLINSGNHEYLIANCPEYKELFFAQAEKYLT